MKSSIMVAFKNVIEDLQGFGNDGESNGKQRTWNAE